MATTIQDDINAIVDRRVGSQHAQGWTAVLANLNDFHPADATAVDRAFLNERIAFSAWQEAKALQNAGETEALTGAWREALKAYNNATHAAAATAGNHHTEPIVYVLASKLLHKTGFILLNCVFFLAQFIFCLAFGFTRKICQDEQTDQGTIMTICHSCRDDSFCPGVVLSTAGFVLAFGWFVGPIVVAVGLCLFYFRVFWFILSIVVCILLGFLVNFGWFVCGAFVFVFGFLCAAKFCFPIKTAVPELWREWREQALAFLA